MHHARSGFYLQYRFIKKMQHSTEYYYYTPRYTKRRSRGHISCYNIVLLASPYSACVIGPHKVHGSLLAYINHVK